MKIGLLLPQSGVDATQGTDAARGVELYLANNHGGAEVVKEDDQAKPEVALAKLRKLVEADRVDFLIGPISSAVALAIRDYVHDHVVPLLVPAAFTRVLTSPVRDALKNALPMIKPPRGPMHFDAYRQAVTPIYITRTEKKAGRIVNVVIDALPGISQEATWGWWNRS